MNAPYLPHNHWYGAVAHWTLTVLVWGMGAWLTCRWAKKRQVLPALVRFGLGKREVIVLAVGLVLVGAYTLIDSQVSGVVFRQVYHEYVGFRQMYGAHAWITSIWQNFYYLFEVVIVIMIVAFFQRAGELWFANSARTPAGRQSEGVHKSRAGYQKQDGNRTSDQPLSDRH